MTRPSWAILAPPLALLCVSAVVASCGQQSSDARSIAAHPATHDRHFRFFSPTSFWNTPSGRGATLDPNSREIVDALHEEVTDELKDGSGPWINTTSYSVPILRVRRGQRPVEVRLVSSYAAPALRHAFRAVPLPPHAKPSAGNDAHLVVWQPGSDRLWEFWHLRRAASGWKAAWGGAIDRVSSSSGAYGPKAWPGATPFWGASASSLSIAGGILTLEDLNHGRVDHALAMSLPDVREGVYSLPARRTDGNSSDPLSLPEGAHLRLPPDLDLHRLHLPRLTMMVARAAQRYGIFIRDRAHNIAFNAQAPKSLARNPYAGPSGFFEDKPPRELLASFPWGDLQLLKMRLRSFVLPGHSPTM